MHDLDQKTLAVDIYLPLLFFLSEYFTNLPFPTWPNLLAASFLLLLPPSSSNVVYLSPWLATQSAKEAFHPTVRRRMDAFFPPSPPPQPKTKEFLTFYCVQIIWQGEEEEEEVEVLGHESWGSFFFYYFGQGVSRHKKNCTRS